MFLLTILDFLQCDFCQLFLKVEALCMVTYRKISDRNLPADLILSVTLDDILYMNTETVFIDCDKESLQGAFNCREQEEHFFSF